MEEFTSFSNDTLQFLTDLRANNTRDWFAENKARYEAHVKDSGQHFAATMVGALRELTGELHASKVFRIHRDVRFSKDKTPYNAHLHIAFMKEGGASADPMWFWGLSPEKVSLGCGVFQYDKASLPRFREAMAGPLGAELIRLGEELTAGGVRVRDPELKRVPADFDREHPHADALRRKGFAAWIDKDDLQFVTTPDLVARTLREFEKLLPVYKFLTRVR